MSDLKVKHKCPNCGAPVTLAEADRFLTCGFCKVRLYMRMPGMPRYVLPSNEPLTDDTVHVPYLRMRGMYFTLRDAGVAEGKVLDTSLKAAAVDFMPEGLGVRPQALELLPAPEDSARLPLRAAPEDMLRKTMGGARMSDAFGSAEDAIRYRSFIGDSSCVIYYPVRPDGGGVRDCVEGRTMAQLTAGRRDSITARAPHDGWAIKFVAAKCPRCGWDLDAKGKAAALLCRNCTSVWRMPAQDSEGPASFSPVEFHTVRDQEGAPPPSCYIPFWRMRADVTGELSASTYGDLIRLANLPLVATPELNAVPLHFWVPAFRCPPTLFLRLSRQLTGARPRPELMDSGSLPPAQGPQVYEPTLSAEDAPEAAHLIFASMITKRKETFKQLGSTRIEPKGYEFVYIPFGERGGDYVHQLLGFAIPKAALTYK